MGPIAAVWATGMRERGHDVSVVTAHPHYPPLWGSRIRPYREVRDGVPILRLPIWSGHRTTVARVREEVTYAAAAAITLAATPPPDIYVVVSPAFLALAPVIAATRRRRRPWVLWLQDILPDAAATTGLLKREITLAPARALERAAYKAATRIVVISESFRRTLVTKGVDEQKMSTIYNPATRGFARTVDRVKSSPVQILHIGNIGHSQGLANVVRIFESSSIEARLTIVGTGELENAVRAEIRTERVEMLGLVDDATLDDALSNAAVGLVTQRPDVVEFNVPSRVMTLMAQGIPIVAVARPDSEVARLVTRSSGGWVADCRDSDAVAAALRAAVEQPEERRRRAESALTFAKDMFDPAGFCKTFESVLMESAGVFRLNS